MNLPTPKLSSHFSIRPVSPDDREPLTRFFESNNRVEIVHQFHPFPLTAETARWIVLEPHQDLYFVAMNNDVGEIIGLGMLRGWEEGYKTPSFGVLVDVAMHGKGVGRKLTEFAIEVARQRGCQSVRLSVYSDNVPALALYNKLGFSEATRSLVEMMGRVTYKIIMFKEL